MTEITIADAMARLRTALKEESGPGSYRDTWVANIAMSIYDEGIHGPGGWTKSRKAFHAFCNRAADRFVTLLEKTGEKP